MTLTCQDQAKRLDLQPGNVFALSQNAEGKTLRVLAGMVWVTDTPASGDRILCEGEEFSLGGRYPYVIEALGAASMEVA